MLVKIYNNNSSIQSILNYFEEHLVEINCLHATKKNSMYQSQATSPRMKISINIHAFSALFFSKECLKAGKMSSSFQIQ